MSAQPGPQETPQKSKVALYSLEIASYLAMTHGENCIHLHIRIFTHPHIVIPTYQHSIRW